MEQGPIPYFSGDRLVQPASVPGLFTEFKEPLPCKDFCLTVLAMIVNGQELDPAASGIASLTDLIRHFELDPETIAVEMNGHVPERETWDSVSVGQGDRIELIRFVGGG